MPHSQDPYGLRSLSHQIDQIGRVVQLLLPEEWWREHADHLIMWKSFDLYLTTDATDDNLLREAQYKLRGEEIIQGAQFWQPPIIRPFEINDQIRDPSVLDQVVSIAQEVASQ